MNRTASRFGRKMLSWSSVASVTIVTLLLAAVAHAELGVGAKGAWVTNRETDNSVAMYGGFVRLGHPMLSLEAGMDYRNEEFAGGSVKTWPVTVGLVLSPIPVVYAVAGVGWYHTSIDFAPASPLADATSTAMGYHVGAGLRLPIVPWVSAIADVRYAYVNYKFDEFKDAVIDFDKGNFVSLNGGLMFQVPTSTKAQ